MIEQVLSLQKEGVEQPQFFLLTFRFMQAGVQATSKQSSLEQKPICGECWRKVEYRATKSINFSQPPTR